MANKSYDERRRNYYDHQGANLESREKLRKAGVKRNTPNQPMMDATHSGMAKRMKQGDRRRQADLYLDQLTRSLKGK